MKQVASHEVGAALLSVLLLVAIMSLAALAMMELTLGGISVAKSADSRARSQWQVVGAEQAGLVGVQRLWVGSEGDINDSVPGFRQDLVINANGADISTRIEEASNCFNLNALLSDVGDEDTQSRAESNFRVLLEVLEFNEFEADTLVDTLIDWMDEDNIPRLSGAEDNFYANKRPSYRTLGDRLANLSELRAIKGYTQDVFQRLAPFVCVRPNSDLSVMNVNTLMPEQSPHLVVAFSGELALETAQRLLTTRPIGGWPTLDDMFEDSSIEEIATDLRQVDLLSTQSKYLQLEGEILDSDQGRQFSVLYELDEGRSAQIVSRSYGGA